jgi:hypothetical protein
MTPLNRSVATQRPVYNTVTAAVVTHAPIEELLEMIFYAGAVPRLNKEN